MRMQQSYNFEFADLVKHHNQINPHLNEASIDTQLLLWQKSENRVRIKTLYALF